MSAVFSNTCKVKSYISINGNLIIIVQFLKKKKKRKKTILVHWNYPQVFLAADGQDKSGLPLEKVGPTISSCTVVS